MSDVSDKAERRGRSVRRARSIYQVHYSLRRRDDEVMAKPLAMPSAGPAPGPLELQAYGRQVAGHRESDDTKYLGLLQCNNGTILKPILKEAQRREIDFYSRITTAPEPELVELRGCAPKYFGCRQFTYNGHQLEYIILEDLTERMLEPCIMDVKIGRRTWDPLATEEKIQSEQSKYLLCKQQFGFCIPGFQVYRLATGRLHKYNKDYGKRLHGHAVSDAIRSYLNGSRGHVCRALVLQLLSQLWRVQKWARRQRSVRLYSASLLLVYDAARLRTCCQDTDDLASRIKCQTTALPRRRSIHSTSPAGAGSNFSGQLSVQGPVYSRVQSVPLSPLPLARAAFSPPPPITSPWTDALDRLHHNHSFEHNYENKLSKIKMNYRAMLDQLSYDSPTPNPWGTVKIIDFAHAFFNEEEERSVDDNFREGIDNFVEVFECFLRETDDQVN